MPFKEVSVSKVLRGLNQKNLLGIKITNKVDLDQAKPLCVIPTELLLF